MPKKPISTEQRVVLQDVKWDQYEQLLKELGAKRQTRLTFCRGKLEMMHPIEAHERCSKLIESLLIVLGEEKQFPLTTIAPIVLKHPEYGYATETDTGYYLQENAPQKRKAAVVLPTDPPPDILVEVSLTKSTIEKLPLYATLGIPEVWRYLTTAGDDVLKGNLRIYHLENGDYVEHSHSLCLPYLPADRIQQFLEQSDSMSLAAALRVLRSWAEELPD